MNTMICMFCFFCISHKVFSVDTLMSSFVFTDEELKETMGGQLDSENPNLAFLKKCLLRHIVGKGELSRGMVFVRTRALAKALTSWLNSCGDREIEDLDAKVFTGTNATAADGGGFNMSFILALFYCSVMNINRMSVHIKFEDTLDINIQDCIHYRKCI